MDQDFGEDISQYTDDELLQLVNIRFQDHADAVTDSARRELESRGFKLLRTGSDFEVISPTGVRLTPPQTEPEAAEFQTGAESSSAHRAGPTQFAPIDFRYQGVGGWLMFLVISLILIRPLMLCSVLGQYEQFWGPHYGSYPFLKVIRIVNLVVGLGAICFSIYAGYCLLKIRPRAVEITKTYLAISAIALCLVEPLLLFSGFPERVNSEILRALPLDTIQGFVYPTIWYLYLSKSKRVATTYTPHNLTS